MSDGIAAMYDEYDSYVARCRRLKVAPVIWNAYDIAKEVYKSHRITLDFLEGVYKPREQHNLGYN